jgi:hypothetical protein
MEAKKTAFAFDLGGGLSYRIVKCVAINLKADYFNTQPDFTIENSQRLNSAGRRIDSYNQPLSAINLSLGVAWLPGKK